MATIDLTAGNFEDTLNKNDIVLVDFWASWCGPCKAFGPIYEAVSERHSDIVFGKVDTEAQQEIAASFGIRSIPTLALFREQILLFMQPGMLPEEALDDIISQARTLDMDEVKQKIDEEKEKQ